MIKVLQRRRKIIALFFSLLFVLQLITPSVVYALTSGPTQPEVQGFQPAGTSDMVNLFSGDFSYNIPLFELPGPNGGYPFNLSYQSGIGMDQESSWSGLGWSLNPGTITRQMRGLPDEFKGDIIYTRMTIKPTITIGVGAGVSLEVFGGDKTEGGKEKAGKPTLTVGFSIYNNNYKGVGYSIEGTIGYAKTNGGMAGTGVNLGMSLDSQEGVNVSPSLTLGTKVGDFGVGAGYNSKTGLSSISLSHDVTRAEQIEGQKAHRTDESVGQSVSLSLASPGYTPQVTMPMVSSNIAATFKAGGGFQGVFASPYVKGFYNEQRLEHDNKRVPTKAYGYLNYQHSTDQHALVDVNREKDGVVSKESPNLAIPSLSYDIYSVVGQGISAMYRPMRNDYGIVRDPRAISTSTGGSGGVDVGPASHVGVNLSVNHSKSVSGEWTDKNEMRDAVSFKKLTTDAANEAYFFKVHGEHSVEKTDAIDAIGGDKAVRIALGGDNYGAYADDRLEFSHSPSPFEMPSGSLARKPRTQVIQPITNEQLIDTNNIELLSQFKIKYQDSAGDEQLYNRGKLPKHHTAGFTALTPEGVQYIYGIPAYNISQEDVTFSTGGGDDRGRADIQKNCDECDPEYETGDRFLKRVQLPSYAHSYLLTSIIGPDYVDVTNDGVTTDDLGYWVKFTYRNMTQDGDLYNWRDPFSGGHLQEGWKTDKNDNRGSFVFGKKELWYLSQAETKSHIAVFKLKARDDARGALNIVQGKGGGIGKHMYALHEIVLFTRSAGSSHPIKRVVLDHDYSLCPGVENNASGGGKLTLKRVWFEYGNSKRGGLNPYIFSYSDSNPSYDNLAYDRWGNYKPYPAEDFQHNQDFPYVEQDPSKKDVLDKNVAAWSLSAIQLPSGGKILVDYETDDYAYVQHKTAMQMTALVDPYTDAVSASTNGEFKLSNDTKIRFKLEQPINCDSVNCNTLDQRAEVLKYLDIQRKQVYFKIKVNLGKPSKNFYEYISGYADINLQGEMKLEKDASGNFVYGSFYLVKEKGFHPFSMRAWQHLRTNQPDKANEGPPVEKGNTTGQKVDKIRSLSGTVAEVRKMFRGYFKYCNDRDWGKELYAGKSWIRLNSPDKIKYGGGLRVRQITMKDLWAYDHEGVYGQVYEYTKQEGDKTISSGVAAYEPLVGGDENPLRYAKKYTESTTPLKADNNLFFEYPINETYYPGPDVGYSKVTVKSLASASLDGTEKIKNIELPGGGGKDIFPKGTGISYGTSGVTVHEFYTAKDFPVITDETEKKDKPYKLPLLIPLIGSITVAKLTTSQGYSIVTNDMHGKPKMVSNFRQDKHGNIEPEPISWVKYNYACKERYYDGEKISELNNLFKKNVNGSLSLINSTDGASIDKYTLGQENEFFMDMREFEDKAWSGGTRFNTDLLFVFIGVIPIPVPWPSITKSTSHLRMAVTNKVIFKSGILESTEAYDGGSLVTTSNLKWDALTGAPILTRVNNNFNLPIFSYSIPAYTNYQGMGAAYNNIGLTFSLDNIQQDTYEKTTYEFTTKITDGALLAPGDEILLYPKDGKFTNPLAKVVYTGVHDDRKILFSNVDLKAKEYEGMIVRSGYRNQLSVQAGNITALEDPSLKGTPKTFTKTITIPQ
jgi:hypothetical protein